MEPIMNKEFINKVIRIQQELKCEKGQNNDFGHYKYRSCADILAAVKPLLAKEGLLILLNDGIEVKGDRTYMVAYASITDGENSIETTAYAREQESKKGMDESQVTGTASSYARKYALGGLLAIDDTKDADALPPDKAEDDSKISEYQLKALTSYKEETQKWVENHFKVAIKDMSRQEATEALKVLEEAKKKQNANVEN